MRTLSEIIEAAKNGDPVTNEELVYAICAIDALATFDRMDIQQAAERERDGKRTFVTAWSRFEESWKRWKAALGKNPKDWLGWNNDPQNPEYRARRARANGILDSAIAGTLKKKMGWE